MAFKDLFLDEDKSVSITRTPFSEKIAGAMALSNTGEIAIAFFSYDKTLLFFLNKKEMVEIPFFPTHMSFSTDDNQLLIAREGECPILVSFGIDIKSPAVDTEVPIEDIGFLEKCVRTRASLEKDIEFLTNEYIKRPTADRNLLEIYVRFLDFLKEDTSAQSMDMEFLKRCERFFESLKVYIDSQKGDINVHVVDTEYLEKHWKSLDSLKNYIRSQDKIDAISTLISLKSDKDHPSFKIDSPILDLFWDNWDEGVVVTQKGVFHLMADSLKTISATPIWDSSIISSKINNEKMVYALCKDFNLYEVDVATGDARKLYSVPHFKDSCDLSHLISPNGTYVARLNKDEVTVFENGKPYFVHRVSRFDRFDEDMEITSLNFSPDETCLLLGDSSGNVWCIDMLTKKEIAEMPLFEAEEEGDIPPAVHLICTHKNGFSVAYKDTITYTSYRKF